MENSTNKSGVYVKLEDTLEGIEKIINGAFDNVDETELRYIGTIKDIKK